MARWLQRRMVFLCGYDWDSIQVGNHLHTDQDEEEKNNWVIKNGGTVEFCQRKVSLEDESQADMEDTADLNNWHFFDPHSTTSDTGEIIHGYDYEASDDEDSVQTLDEMV